MKNNEKKKKYPWYVLLIADILLAGVILCTFSYFHHVRMFLYGDMASDNVIESFAKNDKDDAGGERLAGHINHKWLLEETCEATCTEGGYKKYVCECGEIKYEERTSPTGHQRTQIRNAVPATDKSKGYTGDLYCLDCGTCIGVGSEIPATSHENLVLINERESTCYENGYSGDWYCFDCGEIVAYGGPTPLKEHSYLIKETIDPTCLAEGYTLKVCSICGAEFKDNYMPRIDHAAGKDGRCVMCGINMLDDSGDFGDSFPGVFLQNADRVTLSDDKSIRNYANENGISLKDHADGKYIGLYRSHDIFISLLEVNTDLYYEGTKKTYYVQYYVYDIYVRNIENLFTVYNSSGRKDAEDLIEKGENANGKEVIAAINGDYMGNLNHCLVCERNGDLLRMPDHVESDVCVLYYDGTMETVSPNKYDKDEIAAKRPYQIWNFGPALIGSDGKAIEKYSNSSYDGNVIDSRHPRSSIGYYEPGHYSFIMVDGRSDDSQGVRMIQLARLHEEFGSVAAYNMDGGDSAQAYFNDTRIRVDEDRGSDQRKLYDIICIGEVSSK